VLYLATINPTLIDVRRFGQALDLDEKKRPLNQFLDDDDEPEQERGGGTEVN